MIPFARILNYGNTVETALVKDFFLDDANASPTSWILLSNGELWGSCSQNYGYALALPITSPHYGQMYKSAENVDRAFGSTWGTFILTTDNKIMHTGRVYFYTGNADYVYQWTDRSSYYPFIASDIKKIVFSAGTVMFLLNDGSVYGHGQNIYGVLGRGNETQILTPVLIRSNVNDIWLSGNNGVCQDNDGKFYATGNNSYRQMQTTSTTNYTSWTQIFSAATSSVGYVYNAFRNGGTHFMLFSSDRRYFCSGRNYAGAWGIGNVSVDADVALYNATLPFEPGNLLSFFGTANQAYWTNMIVSIDGTVYYAGYTDGDGSSQNLTFLPTYTIQGDGNMFRGQTNTRMFALCALGSPPNMYARGTATTQRNGVGFTPSSTPLGPTYLHITDFNLK